MRAPLRFFGEVSQCGDREVVQFALLWIRCHLVVNPEGVQHVLTHGEEYSRVTPDTAVFRQAVGLSLLTTEGPPWLFARRLMHPVFSRAAISAFGDIVTGATRTMCGRWEQQRQGLSGDQALDQVEQMRQLTLAIVARSLFSIDITTVDLGQHIDALGGVIGEMFRSPGIALPSLGMPLPPNLRLRSVLHRLDKELYPIIDAHLCDVREGTGEYRDLLTLLIAARDEEGRALSRQELRNELLDLLLAGQETTASLLVWALALLALHPPVQEQLYEELAGEADSPPPGAQELAGLPLLTAIVQETLRMYPPAWMVARLALKDDEVCGHAIPRGSIVFLSPWVSQRHAGCWQDPEQFRPERFAPGQTAPLRGTYFPFGMGAHRCIGEHFALMEAKLVLATLVRRYRLRLKNPALTPGVFPALRPVGGLPMYLDPR